MYFHRQTGSVQNQVLIPSQEVVVPTSMCNEHIALLAAAQTSCQFSFVEENVWHQQYMKGAAFISLQPILSLGTEISKRMPLLLSAFSFEFCMLSNFHLHSVLSIIHFALNS